MKALTKATEDYLRPPTGTHFKEDECHLTLTGKDNEFFLATFWRPSTFYAGGRASCSQGTIRWLERFPEKKRVNPEANVWQYELPVTDLVCERLKNAWGDRITFEDDVTKMTFNNVIVRGLLADANAKRYAEFKKEGKVPEHSYTLHDEFPLKAHQQVALVSSSLSPGFGLLKEQGTGKTPVVIARVCNDAPKHYETTGRPYSALIVAPRNVRANWKAEFEKFGTCPGKVTILHGTAMNRVRQLIEAFTPSEGDMYNIVICSYETLSRSWEALGEMMIKAGRDWDLAVLDESHYIKNVRTQRFKFSAKLRDISRCRMILTGTPITNTALDLYTQFEFLGKGFSGFYTWKAFRKFFGTYRLDEATGHEILQGMQNVPFLQERLARYTFQVRSAEVQKYLPEISYNIIDCPMSEEQIAEYAEVRDALAIEIEADLDNATDSNRSLVINNVLVKMMKLAQITAGFLTFPDECDDDGNVLREGYTKFYAENKKLDELINVLINKKKEDKTIIWSTYVPAIHLVQKACEDAGIDCVTYYGQTKDEDRERNVERINTDRECRVFIGNPSAGGTGLNLLGYPPKGHKIYKETNTTPDDWDTNVNQVIYYIQDWSPTKRSQSAKRAHREGTRVPIQVTDLVCVGTIDEEIRKRVLQKQIGALEISDIRKILTNVLTGELVND